MLRLAKARDCHRDIRGVFFLSLASVGITAVIYTYKFVY